MRSAILVFCFSGLCACSSSSTTTVDGGSDGSPEIDAEVDAGQDTGPVQGMCDVDTKMGDPSGGTFKSGALTVIVRTPPGYDPTIGAPLVVVYAPAGANASQTEGFTALTPRAKARGYVIAYPDHISPQGTVDFNNAAAVVPAIMDRWCIDPKRIYLTGHSDGGSLTEVLAFRNLVKPAAIAPSAAGVSTQSLVNAKCPTEMVAEMGIHSKNDGLFPVANGFGAKVSEWWAKCNMCDPTPSAPDANNCIVYPNCADGLEVRYCEHGLQHGQWMSSLNDPIFDFFDRFKKP